MNRCLITSLLSLLTAACLSGCLFAYGGIANGYPDTISTRVGLSNGRAYTVALTPGNSFRLGSRELEVRAVAVTRANGSRRVFSEADVAAARQRAVSPEDLLVVGPNGLTTQSAAEFVHAHPEHRP